MFFFQFLFLVMLIPLTLTIIVAILKLIYYKYSKLGQAEYNKKKYEREQFINKWGKQ